MRKNYREIADDLASRIARRDTSLLREPGGGWDGPLLTYKDFAKSYDVSVSTMMRALSILEERRLTYGESGRGVYVRGPGEGEKRRS